MRRPNFKGWVSRELAHLSGENTLNLRRLAFLAQGPIPRLWERLVLYAVATNKVNQLKALLYRDEMIEELDKVSHGLLGFTLSNPENAKALQLPLRFQKVLHSYKAAYEKIDTRNESKRLRREKTIHLQKKSGISNTQICRALDLDLGNVTAYLKNADLDRISLKKATAIMKYLQTDSVS